MIAFVRAVTSGAMASGSMLQSESRTSAKIGRAPQCTTTFAVAGHVIGLVITSSPGPTPSATSERWSAAVPDATASTCFAPRYSSNRSSSRAARGPVVSQPERIASAAASTSSSPIAGGWNPTRLDKSFCIDGLKAYEVGRTGSPLERLGAVGAHRQHGPGAVGPAPQRRQHVAGLAVDPDVEHALDRARRLEPRDAPQHARPRDEEADAGAADPRLRARRRDRL